MMLRLGPKLLTELRDLVFPSCPQNFQDELCNVVLDERTDKVIILNSEADQQLLSILRFANTRTRVDDIIQRCRGWTPALAAVLDAFLMRLGSPAERLLPGKVAFLDRAELRGHLEEILDPASAARIVVIKGPTPSGKTHSSSLIGRVGKGLVGANIQSIWLNEYATDPTMEPVDLMETIIRRLFIPKGEMPTGRRAQDARIVLKLVDWFVGAFNNRRDPDTPVWLVLDGFHLKGCPQWLEELAIQIAHQAATRQIDGLYLFLIGLDDAKVHFPNDCDGAVRVEETMPFTRDHVWTIVDDYAKTLKLTIDYAVKDAILDAIFKDIALPIDHVQMKEIAHRVVAIVQQILRNTLAANTAESGERT